METKPFLYLSELYIYKVKFCTRCRSWSLPSTAACSFCRLNCCNAGLWVTEGAESELLASPLAMLNSSSDPIEPVVNLRDERLRNTTLLFEGLQQNNLKIPHALRWSPQRRRTRQGRSQLFEWKNSLKCTESGWVFKSLLFVLDRQIIQRGQSFLLVDFEVFPCCIYLIYEPKHNFMWQFNIKTLKKISQGGPCFLVPFRYYPVLPCSHGFPLFVPSLTYLLSTFPLHQHLVGLTFPENRLPFPYSSKPLGDPQEWRLLFLFSP